MSKSLGNYKTIRDILETYSPEVVRYFILSGHYRKPLNFSKDNLENAKNSYGRLKNLVSEIKDDKKTDKKYLKDFEKEMDDDLNTPNALQVLWKFVRDKKAEGKYKGIKKINDVFDLNLFEKEKIDIPKELKDLLNERNNARNEKDWSKADKIRETIKKKGYIIEDKEGESILIKI